MRGSRDPVRKVVSTGVALLMLSLSAAVPMLERADIVTAPIAESEHNPATCPPAHDHTVCTQVGSNLAAPPPAPQRRMAETVADAEAPRRAVAAVTTVFFDGHRSRAPPRT